MWRDSVEDLQKKNNFKLKDWKETKKNIKKSYKYIKNDKKGLIVVIITSILMMPMSILNPLLSARMLLDLNGELYTDLLKVAAFVAVVFLIENILLFISRISYQKYTMRINFVIQKEVIDETFKLTTKCLDDNGTGLFIDRLRSDTNNIITVFESISDSIIEILTNIGILSVVFFTNKIMFIYFIIGGIKRIILEKYRLKRFYETHAEIKKMEEKNTGLVSELIRGARDIKVLNANHVFMKKFSNRIEETNDSRIKLTIKDRKFYLIESTIDNIFDFLFFVLGVFLIKKDLLLPASFVVLYMYKDRVANLFNYFTYLIDHMKSFNLSANRVFSIIDSKEFPKEKFGKKELDNVLGNFEFRNVSFSYNEEKEILHKLSFKVEANKTTAFVGRSGSGKTTIFSLMNKLYSVDDNHIFIDGNDINSLTKDTIRDNISVITQNPYIFNLSIRENLSLVKENLTEEEMIEACKMASLHDFIMSLPKGYDTMVGEGGVSLSGGERQRLAIARALIKKTKIILFDEATSSLDNETQENIKKAINNLQGQYTILIIAHRLSTIINSDKIIMIQDGKKVCEGTHKELLENSIEYYKLYEADLEQE